MALVFLNDADTTADTNLNPTNFVYLDTTTREIVYLSSNNFTELFRIGGGAAQPTVFNAAMAQADFAAAAFVAYLVGQNVATADYNATGDGGVFEKVSLTNGNFNDWRVVSTELVASTGGIGNVPA